jgi:iron complex transport system substrate-binding protein
MGGNVSTNHPVTGRARSGALFAALAGLVSVLCWTASALAAPPRKVVSVNVCTDQLALLVADKGQLHSVSYLASDPNTSVLAGLAKGLTVNHGLAEEVFLMQPDLVLAGTYTTRTTVDLLRRLGIRVEEFAADNSIADIRSNILRMGEVLERRERAAGLVAELDRGVAELGKGANSYTSGAGTLVDEVVKLSGLVNVADKLGLGGTALLPLEMLVLAQPDLVAGGGEDYGAPALAQENFGHPAYQAVAAAGRAVAVPARYTICGTPFTLEAARLLRHASSQIEKAGAQ